MNLLREFIPLPSYKPSFFPTFQFKVLQWNVLANKYATQDAQGFPLVPKEYLTWDFRKNLIKKEILQYQPDIINIEEVDEIEYFEKTFKENGFEVIWHRTTGTGCLFAFNRKKFKVASSEKINLSSGTTQVAVVTILETTDKISGGKKIAFVTTHLKAKFDFAEVRYEQVQEILSEGEFEEYPTVFVGDLNDNPESKTLNLLSTEGFSNPYNNYPLQEGESLWTTYKIRPKTDEATGKQELKPTKATIDYILLRGEELQALSVLSLPHDLLKSEIGLPCQQYPSDHICIGAVISVK